MRVGLKIMLEQNVFDNTTLSFDNNKALKVSIGYAIICSSMSNLRIFF